MSNNQYSRLSAIDGLRCLAVLAVVIHHHFPYKHGAVLKWFSDFGWIGVDLFFVVSGFLITSLLLKEAQSTGKIHLGYFWVRRFLRLWPLWLISFMLSSLIVWYHAQKNPEFIPLYWKIAPWYLLCLGNYSIVWFGWGVPAFGHYWSLAIEDHFYVFWPLVLWLTVKRPKLQLALAVAAVIIPIFIRLAYAPMALVGDQKSLLALHHTTHARFDSLAWGCLLALVFPRLPKLKRYSEVLLLLLSFAFFALYTLWRWKYGRTLVSISIGYTWIALGSALLVWVAVAGGEWGIKRLLSLKWVVFGGRVSYGVYLVHVLMLPVIFKINTEVRNYGVPLPFMLELVINTLLVFGAGALLFYAVDRPIEAIRARFRRA